MILTVILGFFKILGVILFVLTYKAKVDVKPNIVSRNEWNATQINDTLTDLVLPLDRIIIAHTVTKECFTKDECISIVKYIQQLHLSADFKFSDIGYNFLIGGDGNVYEGRSWYKQGAHTAGYNRGSIGIAFIGNFNFKIPNEEQIAAGFALIAKGKTLKIFTNDFTIFGASQLRNTQSPGDALMNLIKTWPHSSQISTG
ncbi:hypothetical protein ACKWTF_011800 [Chironomus riparius]